MNKSWMPSGGGGDKLLVQSISDRLMCPARIVVCCGLISSFRIELRVLLQKLSHPGPELGVLCQISSLFHEK